MKQRILTGDRPTGPLHIGRLVGSLRSRVALRGEYEPYVLLRPVPRLPGPEHLSQRSLLHDRAERVKLNEELGEWKCQTPLI